MKLHLPFSLLSIILASSVYAVEIPSDYETEDLWVNVQLDEYMANEEVDKWAFVLWSDTTFTPSSNPVWTSSNALVTGKSHIFTTSEYSTPVKLNFTGGEMTVFEQPSDLKFDTLSKLCFSNQSVRQNGGTIDLGSNGKLSIQNISDEEKDTPDVEFSNNVISSASALYGGAIYASGESTVIDISNNGSVLFSSNSSAPSANAFGGAIYSAGMVSVDSNKNDVVFLANHASDVSTNTGINHAAYGGAIYSTNNVDISNNAGNVNFIQNHASAAYAGSKYVYTEMYPGIVSGGGYVYLDSYALGGALYSSQDITISNNAGNVCFQKNYVEASACYDSDIKVHGGAIYSTGSLSIVGNEAVTFEKNYERSSASTTGNTYTYRLRSIYMAADNASDALILAAKTGGHITFYDSVYMQFSSGSVVSMNADYTDANGETQKAEGAIIFSGKYTAEHLAEVKNSEGTVAEIINSQTSEINNHITLFGGSLQVVDGAKLNGHGITVAADSGARLLLRDASMTHTSHSFSYNPTSWLEFNATSELELQGINTVIASKLTMGQDSKLSVTLGEEHLTTAALSLVNNTDLYTSKLTVNLNRTDGMGSGLFKIISLDAASDFVTNAEWTKENVAVTGRNGASLASFDDLVWEGGTLYYKVERTTWRNASGDRLWNTSSDNWTMNDHSYTYMDGMDVLFSDAGAGEVVLEGAIAPASIVVSNSEGCDYTFTAGDRSGRLMGASSIIKSGAGALTISTANEHTGNTDLQQGSINVHHSTALGATAEGVASLSAVAGTTLRVGNKSLLVLASSNNSLTGDVVVDDGSTLEMKGSGYSAATSSVNGTLAFTGTEGTIGTLSGNGMLEVTNSKVAVSTISDYKGSIILQGGRLELLSSLDLKLRDGGMLSMSAIDGVAATLDARTVNVTTGTTLSVQDILGNNGAAPGEVETSDFLNSTVGGSMEISRLTLTYGSSLVMGNAHLALNGGSLTLAVPSSVNDKIHLDMVVDGLAISESGVLLFSEVESVSFIYDGSTVSSGTGVHYFAAVNYFVGYGLNASTRLVYDSNRNVVYLQGLEIIPEPATATLSLLALTALAARRRRKDA